MPRRQPATFSRPRESSQAFLSLSLSLSLSFSLAIQICPNVANVVHWFFRLFFSFLLSLRLCLLRCIFENDPRARARSSSAYLSNSPALASSVCPLSLVTSVCVRACEKRTDNERVKRHAKITGYTTCGASFSSTIDLTF